MSAECRVLTFRLADRDFGLPVAAVEEVLFAQPMTRVPLAPPAVRGLINLRGRIVPAVDLRRRLELPDRAADRPPMVVVVSAGGGAGLLVDEVGDILAPPAGASERPPDTLTAPARELVRGVLKLDGRLLLVLDADRAAAVPTRADPAPTD